MRKQRIGIGGAVLLMTVLGPAMAQAGMITYTADVTAGPGYNRPLNGNPPTSLSGNDNYFDAQPFMVDVTGTYRMEVVSVLSGTGDSFLVLYENSFDPASPLTNVLQTDDDAGAGFLSKIDRVLTAGTNYFLVTTTFAGSLQPSYTNEIEGPGNIRLGSPNAVPEPSSFVLLGIGGMAMAGCVWRRKRRIAA